MSVGLQEYQAANVPPSFFSPVGLIEEPVAVERLDSRLADVARKLIDLLDEVSAQVTQCRSAQEFRAFREEAFPSYMHLMSSLSDLFRAKVAPGDFSQLIDESFASLEAEFSSDNARLYFGEGAYLEVQFCLSTLKSASRWIPYLMSHRPAEEMRGQDIEVAQDYRFSATLTHFHLAALGISLSKAQPIAPDVLQELLDGLRHAVMVYAYIRQALDFRNVLAERYSEPLAISWDAEDRALALAD